MAKRLSRINQVARARKRVQKVITGNANQEKEGTIASMYARGLAGEGYNGGYRDALDDVILLLNGATPYRNGWWED